ncbi:MAG: PEP-CTERM sorting domain-containing protein, partial [Planctomycetota bacterium]
LDTVTSGSWVEVTIQTSGADVQWLLNGTLVDTYDNSGGFYTTGNILVGGMDVFNSSNGNNGVVIDNVQVDGLRIIPEPASYALAALALAGLLGIPKRRIVR